MGVASCHNCCDKNEKEFHNQNLYIEKKGNNKKIINANSLNNNKYTLYTKKFESNLPKIGKYIEKDQFKEIIPEIANEYLIENHIKIPENIQINNNLYEMKPVEFENGNVYKGQWDEEFKMDGLGQYYIKEGNVFIDGIWDDGKLIYGRIFYDNNNIYDGQIKNSNYHGKGKLMFNNKEEYEGDFFDNEVKGHGIFKFSDGTIYEGEFDKGEFKGHGIMKWNNGDIQYEGEFNGSILNDYGKLVGNNGEEYEGNFTNNYFNGKGVYIYSDGSSYKGDFEFGLKNGKGVYTKKDTFVYEGDWANNMPHGFGKFYYKDFIVIAVWRNGVNVEITNFEKGDMSNFDKNILNFEVKAFNLLPHKLPNLVKIDSNVGYGIEITTPSYLNTQNE
jgi:hypothetical protein